jgi:hypothetical protein
MIDEGATTGLGLLCLCTMLPMTIGALLGWWVRGRVLARGWRWAFVPGVVQAAISRFNQFLAELDAEGE